MKMSQSELIEEFKYRYEERIAILCGTGEPTREQMDIAAKESDETIEKIKAQ